MMKNLIFTILFLMIILICKSKQQETHIIHSLFGEIFKNDVVYYGTIDLDKSEYTILNTLNVADVGNPRERKYQIVPLTYDPTNDVVFMSAKNNMNKTILSVLNATTGALLHTFNSIPYEIISLQYDIFNKKLFGHTETTKENLTQIVEIDTNSGEFKQVFGQIDGAKPTDIASYCPICRKYFLIMVENNRFTYVAVNTSDSGGVSWRVPINYSPLNIRFDYKTFNMYSAYINQTDRTVSQIGILNRTSGSIGQVVGIISDQPTITVTRFSAFDIANKLYYISSIKSWPYSRGVSYMSVNTSDVQRVILPESDYNYFAWFIKQFVQ